MPREAVFPEQLDRRLGVSADVRRLRSHSRVRGPPPETVASLSLSHFLERQFILLDGSSEVSLAWNMKT